MKMLERLIMLILSLKSIQIFCCCEIHLQYSIRKLQCKISIGNHSIDLTRFKFFMNLTCTFVLCPHFVNEDSLRWAEGSYEDKSLIQYNGKSGFSTIWENFCEAQVFHAFLSVFLHGQKEDSVTVICALHISQRTFIKANQVRFCSPISNA